MYCSILYIVVYYDDDDDDGLLYTNIYIIASAILECVLSKL